MSSQSIQQKTFRVSKWGTLERQATQRSENTDGLRLKKEKATDGDIKIVYSRNTAISLMEQQKAMIERGNLHHRKSNAHDAFSSCSLIDNIDATERHVVSNSNMENGSFNLTHFCPQRLAYKPYGY